MVTPGKPRAILPRVYAAAIEDNHVHLLFGACEEDISKIAGRLKGTSSSAVLKLPGNEGRDRIWTARYWRVFLFDEVAFAAVRRYIEDHNLRRSLPAAPFPWIWSI